MKKTLAFVFALALTLTTSVAQANTITVFGQNVGGNTVTGTQVAGVTTITATDVLSLITVLNEVGSSFAAEFDFFAVSTAAAVNVGGDVWRQTYDGSFSLIGAGGFNFLSGIFTGQLLGLEDGGTLIFGAAQPPGSLTFTSDVAGMPLGFPTAMALGFTNANPIQITNGSFGNFTANVAGNFSAEAASVPDGGTTAAMLGFAMFGVGLVRRKLSV